MSDSCNSRHFSWLMKSCFPNPNDNNNSSISPATKPTPFNNSDAPYSSSSSSAAASTISSLPDDILLECLSRVPSSSLPSLSLVCRRWSRLLFSPTFSLLRRHQGLLCNTLFAFYASDSALFSATLRFDHSDSSSSSSRWRVSAFLPQDDDVSRSFPSHARISSIGPRIFIIGCNATLCYNTWTGTVTERSPMLFSRKKFAVASVSGKIYIAGGGPRTTEVEEYDPEEDKWRVVATASRSRYGCIGASADGVLYVIGGLKLGGSGNNDLSRAVAAGAEAHVYASSMDLYDVESRAWLRSRALPGGGCVVAAGAAAGFIYVLASHAVEFSFWRFDARRKSGGGFGEWRRIRSPPLPAQVRVDSTVRFSCAGVGDKVVLVQVSGCIDDLLRRSGRSTRGLNEGLVLVYDTAAEEWARAADLPAIIRRASCVCVEC